MMAAYFDQFTIVTLGSLIFTNSSLMFLAAIGVAILLFKGNRLVPFRWQIIFEVICDHWYGVVKDNLGLKGMKFFPFVFTLFILLVFLNVLGLCPYVFTVPAHIVVTFGISFSLIFAVTIMGFLKFRWEFLSILMPAGAPLGLAPLLVLIETVSYISRAISLGVRLAANLSAGHLLFAIIASFSFIMLTNGMALLSVFPILILIFITILEIAVAMIQAYVFCLLTTIYLNDTLALH